MWNLCGTATSKRRRAIGEAFPDRTQRPAFAGRILAETSMGSRTRVPLRSFRSCGTVWMRMSRRRTNVQSEDWIEGFLPKKYLRSLGCVLVLVLMCSRGLSDSHPSRSGEPIRSQRTFASASPRCMRPKMSCELAQGDPRREECVGAKWA